MLKMLCGWKNNMQLIPNLKFEIYLQIKVNFTNLCIIINFKKHIFLNLHHKINDIHLTKSLEIFSFFKKFTVKIPHIMYDET